MKHNLQITILLLTMFLVTQLLGIVVLKADPFHINKEVNGSIQKVPNPYLSWIQPPEATTAKESYSLLTSLIISFTIAIILLLVLSRFKIEFVLKSWFFLVVAIALFITIYSLEKISLTKIPTLILIIISSLIAVPLAFIKIYKKEFIIHNITEIMIYPGIATIFVPILNIITMIIFLIIISIYDAWAVWHSGIMQKMAKYQINKLNIFSGFFVPYVSKKVKLKIQEYKKENKKIKLNIAILGGGDVVFPIITAGVMLKTFGLASAFFVILGSILGLSYLFFFAEKKKFYPAMPFITAGIFIGMIANWLITLIF
jgi:presenilin-like A22 family membrane protease